jgi:N-acetylglucosamine-6-sulfatase
MYEDSIRVPLLVRYPPLAKPGTVVQQMILNHDLAPSVLDVCRAKPLRDITGRSWKPLLQGKRVAWREVFLYEYNYEKQFPYTPNVRGVRTPEWKLIRYPNGDGKPDRFTAELYNLRDDPLEMKNLVNDPAAASMRKKLERELERQSRQAGRDEMPVYEGIVNVLPKY